MDKISLSRLHLNLIWCIFENNNLSIKTVPLSSIKGTFLKGFKLSISSVRCCPIKKKESKFYFYFSCKVKIFFIYLPCLKFNGFGSNGISVFFINMYKVLLG